MPASESELLTSLVVEAQLRGAIDAWTAVSLARWIERAELRQVSLARAAPAFVAVPPGPLEPPAVRRPRPAKTRSQRRREAREDAHRREVERWFGERPPLPSERRRLFDYEPRDRLG